MRKSFLWLGSLLLILQMAGCRDHECPTAIVKQVTLQGPAIMDVGANSNYPDVNRALDGRMHTCAWTFSGNFGVARNWMNFDLSSIPPDATILTAILTLYADTTNYTNATIVGHSSLTGSNEWKIKRVTSDWQENTLTWNNRPTSDDVGVIYMPESTSNDQTYKVDIASFLNDQLRNPTRYFGIMLQLRTEVSYRMIAFCTKDHIYAATLKPILKITYKEKGD